MNDMDWGGVGDPEGPFVAGSQAGHLAALKAEGAPVEEDEIAVAQWLFWDYVKDLRAHQAELAQADPREIEPARLKKAVETARTVRDAISLLMQERNKVDKLRKDIAGGVGGGSLDLDAARDEVGRRLACLRRAGGG